MVANEENFLVNIGRLTRSLLAATSLAATVATPAAAQRVDRIVAFGDNYVDTGNAFTLAGLVPPPAVYPAGRFSNGQNYVDILSSLLGAPDLNYGIGGALTDNSNTLPGLPGFQYEYGAFLAGGGAATPPFAANTGFQPNDLLVLSIGGNDARTYQFGGGTVAGAPAAAATAVGNVKAGLDLLVARGVPAISYLSGDTSRLPEVIGDAPAQAVRSAYATSFNGGMQSLLSGYAANGVIVNYLDINLVGNRIIANPAAYGLTSAGPCTLGAACIGPAGNAYLFYFDGVHLTEGGYAIIAKYIWRQTQAPLALQATSDLGIDTAHQFGRTLTQRMDLDSPRDGDTLTGARLFVIGDTSTRKLLATDRNDALKTTTSGVTAGVEFGFGSGSVGLAANYSRPKAVLYNLSSRTHAHSVQLGGFASFGLAGGFAQGYAGYGWDTNRITRTGVIDNLTANPKGHHVLAGAKAGYLMNVGSIRVGPVVGIDYAKAKVASYSETGDAALALNVGALSYSALRASGGLELRGDFGGGGVHLRPFAAAMAEADLTGDGRTVFYSQQAAPTIVNHFAFEDGSKHPYARFNGGFSAAILSNVAVSVAGSATVGKRQGDETSANLAFNLGF